MPRAATLIVAVPILVACLAASGTAGPFEEGVEAYRKQEYVSAMKLWRPLAEAGEARAQAMLGILYRDAHGVPAGRVVIAYIWFSLAASGGDQKAAQERDILARGMTPAQIAEGKKRASEWTRR
jgi:TPR repeat protein